MNTPDNVCAIENCKLTCLTEEGAEGKCILHAPLKDKDINEFQDAIDHIVEQAPKNNDRCDFSKCFFPQDYQVNAGLKKAFQFGLNFISATFSGDANFSSANFSGDAYFSSATFEGYSYFGFTDERHFEHEKETKFKGRVLFNNCQFKKLARFIYTQIHSAEFEGASFKAARFYDVKAISRKTDDDDEPTPPLIEFRYVPFDEDQKVSIHSTDINFWDFEGTDLRPIDFSNMTWMEHSRSFFGKKVAKRLAVFNEINPNLMRLDQPEPGSENEKWITENEGSSREDLRKILPKVERMYRQLKLNFETKKNYVRGGEFYVSEMEMRRLKFDPWSWGRLPHWVYRESSLYGESYGRALWVFFTMGVIFTFIFLILGYEIKMGTNDSMFVGFFPSKDHTAKDFLENLTWGLQHTFRSMTLLGRPDLNFIEGWKSGIAIVLSVIGATQLGFFLVALRRRFRR